MNDVTGELGVAATKTGVLQLGWFFRTQNESDQGIDAQFEKFDNLPGPKGEKKQVATGRLIAAQIKAGPSWFKKSPNGWWFYFSEREMKLWVNHALPVVVVLCDLEGDELYWQRISPKTVRTTKKRYKVEVPRAQTVATANDVWVEMASGLESRAEARFEYSLLHLPPVARKVLSEHQKVGERADAALLAMHLAEGSGNASGTVASLLSASPRWIVDHADWSWAVIGAYASDFDLHALAVDAFERTAEVRSGGPRTRALLAAASHSVADRERAGRLLAEAEEAGGEPILRAAIRTVLSAPPGVNQAMTIDPVLAAGGADVEGSGPAQRVLCLDAQLRDSVEEAVRHARLALVAEPENSNAMCMLAKCLLRRWNLDGRAGADIGEAIGLLRSAIDQRRGWNGENIDHLRDLASALAMNGQLEEVLRTVLPPPFGSARPEEIDAHGVRLAAHAADELGWDDVLAFTLGLLGDEPADRLVMVQVGALEATPEELTELQSAGLNSAIEDNSYTEISKLALALASDGVDVRDRVARFIHDGILPDSLAKLLTVLLVAAKDFDEALPELRELAKKDTIAAEYLLSRLKMAGRYQEAADQAIALFDLTSSSAYLVHRARALIGARSVAQAVAAAKVAVSRADVPDSDKVALLRYLGNRAAEGGESTDAEGYFSEVLNLLEKPSPDDVWRVVWCLLDQGRLAKAGQVIADYRPQVRDVSQAELWLKANAARAWDERTAIEAYTLAERFDDPKLSVALVGQIVLNTHGSEDRPRQGESAEPASVDPALSEADKEEDKSLDRRRALAQNPVPGELHRKAFELMTGLAERHGELAGVTVFSGTPDELVHETIEMFKSASKADEAMSDLWPMVRDSQIPLAFVAATYRRSYATLVTQRAFGSLVASSVNDVEHETEVQVARDALNHSVVVDGATVVTLSALTNAAKLAGSFVSLVIPPSGMLDLHRVGADVRGLAGSPGSMRWDPAAQGLVFTALDEDEYLRLLQRSEQIEAYTDLLAVRRPVDSTFMKELTREAENAPWVDVIQLAHDEGAALWSDDLGLRRMARGWDVAAFGTPALVDALRDIALERSETEEADQRAIQATSALNLEMARDYIGDLVLGNDDILVLAEQDGWRPGAGSVAVSRPAFWVWNENAFAVVRAVIKRARIDAPEALPAWQVAAMHGASRALVPEVASFMLAVLALMAFGPSSDDTERADGLRRARAIATSLELPDPSGFLAKAADLMARAGECDDPKALVDRIRLIVDGDDNAS